MFHKISQRLQMAVFSSHSQLRVGSLFYVWLYLLTTAVSQSLPLILSSSHVDHDDEMLSASRITPHHELHSASVSETVDLPQETLEHYFTSSSQEVDFASEEINLSSDSPEVTSTSLHQEATASFIQVTRVSNRVFSTNLYSTFESPKLPTHSKTPTFFTSSLPPLGSMRISERYSISDIATTSSAIHSPTPIPTSYQETSTHNISTVTNASNIDYASSMSSVKQFALSSNVTENPQSSTFYTKFSTKLEQTTEDIRNLLTTQFVAKKSYSKYDNMRYFLVLKAEICPPLGASGIDEELLKALSSLGIVKVSADISKIRCQTTLHVNITATAAPSFIAKLDDISNQNLTVTVRNKTFQIIDIQQQLYFNKTDARLTSNVINLVAQSIFKAYVAVGSCFGLVLLVCIVAYCYKCWANTSRKRIGLRNNHTALSPEDYTLTPIPRPTTLYVDYYRNSLTADLYSTTSAGSVGSTSPIVETGVVQSFDTSIVPLEDSETHFQKAQRNATEPGSAKEDNVQKVQVVTMDGLIYCNSGTDSTEKLTTNPLYQPKVAGVCNPTYQRY